jgi:DNA repair exonuclease SbcCD ATPase subunit
MTKKATSERHRQVKSLQARYEKTLQVREFLSSEREIVIGLLEKSMRGQDRERINNLRTRIQEKDRQLHLVEEELRDIQAQLAEAERRLRDAQTGDGK